MYFLLHWINSFRCCYGCQEYASSPWSMLWFDYRQRFVFVVSPSFPSSFTTYTYIHTYNVMGDMFSALWLSTMLHAKLEWCEDASSRDDAGPSFRYSPPYIACFHHEALSTLSTTTTIITISFSSLGGSYIMISHGDPDSRMQLIKQFTAPCKMDVKVLTIRTCYSPFFMYLCMYVFMYVCMHGFFVNTCVNKVTILFSVNVWRAQRSQTWRTRNLQELLRRPECTSCMYARSCSVVDLTWPYLR